MRGKVCLLSLSTEERREWISVILPSAVKVFYMGSYYCYHNYHSACTIKVDDGGYMGG